MNILSAILHALARSFEHIIGDPVHTKAATAVKTALGTTAHLVDQGGPEAQGAAEELLEKLEDLNAKGRAVTPDEWDELISLAEGHRAIMAPPETTQEPAPQPSSVPAAS